MEIAQQNGSVWLRPCQSTHKKHSTGENKQPLISSESPQSRESSQNEAPAALCWKSFVEEWGKREKAGVSERGNKAEIGKEKVLPTASAVLHSPHSAFFEKWRRGNTSQNFSIFYLCNVMGIVPMGISHALSHSLNSAVCLCACFF